MIYNIKENDFSIKKGPIFANFVLADEINHLPVQSALLEPCKSAKWPLAILPLSRKSLSWLWQHKTRRARRYLSLARSAGGSFYAKAVIDYPKLEDEQLIVRQNLQSPFEKVKPVVTTKQITTAQATVREVYMDEKIERYIRLILLPVTQRTISWRKSNRSSVLVPPLVEASIWRQRRNAMPLKHRGYVIPEDVRAVIYDILRHRIGLTYEVEAENVTTEDLISQIINHVEVPRTNPKSRAFPAWRQKTYSKSSKIEITSPPKRPRFWGRVPQYL